MQQRKELADAQRQLEALAGDRTPEALRQAGELAQRIKALKPATEYLLDQQELEEAVLAKVAPVALADYGVVIESVGLKRSSLPEKVSQVVMENMRSEREEKAQQAPQLPWSLIGVQPYSSHQLNARGNPMDGAEIVVVSSSAEEPSP